MLRVSGFTFLLFWLSIIVFFPTYIGGMALHTGQKILYVIYPLLACGLLFSAWVPRKRIYIDATCLMLFMFFFMLLASAFAKSTFIDVRLFLAHFRYFAYLLLYCGIYNYVARCQLRPDQLVKALVWLAIAILAFVIIQLVQPSLIEPLGISNRDGIGHLGFRIGGPMVWSYGLAFVLVPVYAYTLVSIFIKAKLSSYVLLVMLLLTILGGQSKAAYLAIVIITGLLLALNFWLVRRARGVKISLFFLACFIGLAAFVLANLEAFGNIDRFAETLAGNGVDASTQTRLNQLSHLEYTIENNIWLGYPKQYVVIENAYGYYFYNYGIVGLIGYLTVMVVIWWRCLRLFFLFQRRCGATDVTKLAAAALCFASAALIFSLANSPLDGHKTAYFYWSFFAAYFGLCARMGVFGIRY